MSKYRLALLLTAVVFLGVSATDIFLSSLPQIATDFAVDADWANMLLNAFLFGSAVGSLVCGIISDYIGRRRIFITSIIIFMISAILIAVIPWLKVLIGLRFLQGLTAAVFIVVSRQVIKDICDEGDQVRYTGMLSIGVMLSPAIAPVFGAYIAHFASWHYCFLASAILAFILLIALMKFLPETLPVRIDLPRIDKLFDEYKIYFCNNLFTFNMLVMAFCYGAYFVFICTSSYIYIDLLKIDQRWFAKIFLLLSGAYLFGNSLMQRLNKKGYSRDKITFIGLAIALLGAIIVSFGLVAHAPLIICLILSIGAMFLRAGYAVLVAPIQVTVMNACPGGRPGTAMGLLMFCLFITGAICGEIVSLAHEHILLATIISVGVLMIVALLIFWLQKRK